MKRAIVLAGALSLAAALPAAAQAPPLSAADRAMAADVFRELIEIPSVSSSPETVRAAEAMAARLEAAGFPVADVRVVGPHDDAGNLVATYRGSGGGPSILLMAHLDVVPAAREDWSVDPFAFTEKDGWWYGRGTSDNKAGAAILVTNLIRWKASGFVPSRDLVVVLTADEETSSESIRWFATGEGRRWIGDPGFALNTDAGGGVLLDGEEATFDVQASEKVYLTYRLTTTNPGGHSSVPRPDNAIYALVDGLRRIAEHRFPVVMNEVTRGFFAAMAGFEDDPDRAADMRALAERADPEGAERLSADPYFNALIRTTCVATRLEAGHADNALPQTARATVNCRVLPGEDLDAVDRTLAEVVADPSIAIERVNDPTPSPPSPLVDSVVGPIRALVEATWPGVPVVPTMSTGATDGLYVRNAGIPVYGVSAIFEDPGDIRAHGRDERIKIRRFYEALGFWDGMVRALAR